MNRFDHKVAVVFAGSRGIGAAIAERLGSEGASVAVNYVSNGSKANEVVKAITAGGSRAFAVQGDVASAVDVARVFDKAVGEYGPVNVVVNAAGQSVFKPIAEVTDDDFEKVFSVNARGALHVLREAAKRVADGGRVIHLSTGGTKMTMLGTGLYAASKAAGEHLALNLAKELGHRNVTVNVVSPGTTNTDGLVLPKEQLAQIVGMTPLGRLGEPADVADVVAFLASDDARWVTGQNIQANGGIL